MDGRNADLAAWWRFAPCGLVVIDEQGIILQVNQTLSDWTGYPMHRLVDRPASELFTAESRLLYLGLLAYRVAEHGTASEVHLALRVTQGEPLPVLCSARLILHQGAPLTLLSMLSVTRKDRLERELIEARQATQQALAEKSATLAGLEAMNDTLSAQREALEQANQQLGQDALSDPLTGLPNRRCFDQTLTQQLRETSLPGTTMPFCVAMLDIDHFKQVNDHHGHATGDRVLQQLGKRLTAQLRGGDLVARLGGEEFVLLMPDTDMEAAHCALERLRLAVETHAWEGVAITLSIGVTEYHSDDTRETLLQRADTALYAAKRAGRNRVHRQLA
ncbi:diguanylate cyclase [Halomonas sp.]|uniref:GGDEF domain-containing protein n=1 Tax=Halomonas sp. TaxID=1486246 RepID=UPI003D0FEAC2